MYIHTLLWSPKPLSPSSSNLRMWSHMRGICSMEWKWNNLVEATRAEMHTCRLRHPTSLVLFLPFLQVSASTAAVRFSPVQKPHTMRLIDSNVRLRFPPSAAFRLCINTCTVAHVPALCTNASHHHHQSLLEKREEASSAFRLPPLDTYSYVHTFLGRSQRQNPMPVVSPLLVEVIVHAKS